MNKLSDRRSFIKTSAVAGIGLSMMKPGIVSAKLLSDTKKRIGIIGLDTSHSIAFTKEFNNPNADAELGGYKVVAAYPKGSSEIESSYKRIPAYTKQIKEMGVSIVNSIDELLELVDVVLLETNDGRLHLEQALPVLKAGKTMFIDKPMTASLSDAIVIFEKAKQYKVPVFSSSSLRYMESTQSAAAGDMGKIVGANTVGPASLEKTHPDLFWYGIHAVEMLYTVMGTGCTSVVRAHTDSTDVVIGTWDDGRLGTVRGTRSGKSGYGGMAYGENGNIKLGPYPGYKPLLIEIAKFFQTKIVPVSSDETLELLAFMEAADESRKLGGVPVKMDVIWERARKKANIS